VYMLSAIRALLQGQPTEIGNRINDASNAWRKAPFVMLTAALVVFGFFPRLLTDQIEPGVARILEPFNRAGAALKAQVPVAKTVSEASARESEGPIPKMR